MAAPLAKTTEWKVCELNEFILFFLYLNDNCETLELFSGAYGGSTASTAELYKNREADLGNPNLHNCNIYHTIDEEKVSKSMEHLYDEIKHRNKDCGKFYFPFNSLCLSFFSRPKAISFSRS